MSRSVLVRLVAVSLLVASCSIAATAWLTTASTRAQFTGDLERTLAGDNNVYNTLLDYGASHSSWTGVQSVIDSLAPSTQRTVTLASQDGAIVASSDPTHRRIPAGAVPTAVVDVLAASVGLPTESIDPDFVVGGLIPSEDVDGGTKPEPASEPATEPLPETDAPALITVVSLLDTSLPTSAFVLDDSERAARKELIDQDVACGKRIGLQLTSATGDFGGYVISPMPNADTVVKLGALCEFGGADEPGSRYLAINAGLVSRVMTCLSARGIEGAVTEVTKSGLRNVTVAADAVTADTASGIAVRQCRADAVRMVMATYSAPPVQLYLASPPTPERSWLSSAGGTRIVIALIIVLVFTLLAAALGARRLLRPIRSLTRAAQRMSTGELHARVLVRGGDEIARLGSAFNTMADSVERNEAQRKMLVSDIAHELRNPLANVRGYLEAAQDRLVQMDDELVDSLLEETLQLQHLIDDLQDLALADAGRLLMHPETTDIVALVARVVAAHRAAAEVAGIRIGFTGTDATPLWIDSVRIKQAVGNLIGNAIRYTQPGGSIDVGVATTATSVAISVNDTGRGISAAELPHLFDRFFRADASRSRATGGSGLGLAITKHLVNAHGGTIDVHSKLGAGSRFIINLPRDASPATTIDSVDAHVEPVGASSPTSPT